MTGSPVSNEPVGIVELVAICDAMEDRHRAAFELLGRRVTTDDPPPSGALARLLVEACHHHAAHADTWAGRRPTIPIDPALQAEPEAGGAPSDRRIRYRDELSALQAEMSTLRSRIDRNLDPSTHRVIDVVDADLDTIAERLDSVA